jgi:hypothetical protein
VLVETNKSTGDALFIPSVNLFGFADVLVVITQRFAPQAPPVPFPPNRVPVPFAPEYTHISIVKLPEPSANAALLAVLR